MAAAVSSVDSSNLTRISGKDAFLSAVKYEPVASVVYQSDNNNTISTVHPKTFSAMA